VTFTATPRPTTATVTPDDAARADGVLRAWSAAVADKGRPDGAIKNGDVFELRGLLIAAFADCRKDAYDDAFADARAAASDPAALDA
jgi:hypothetical protein